MKDFKEEIQRRRNDRRSKKSSSWLNMVARLLLLVFVILMIRFFGKSALTGRSSNSQNNIEQNSND